MNIDAPEPPAMEPTTMGMMTLLVCSLSGIWPQASGATARACAVTSVSCSAVRRGSVSIRPTARYWPAPLLTGMPLAVSRSRGAHPISGAKLLPLLASCASTALAVAR